MAEKPQAPRVTRRFFVASGASVRRSPDPADPRWHEFIDYTPGTEVREANLPAHLDLAGLLASGHFQEV